MAYIIEPKTVRNTTLVILFDPLFLLLIGIACIPWQSLGSPSISIGLHKPALNGVPPSDLRILLSKKFHQLTLTNIVSTFFL